MSISIRAATTDDAELVADFNAHLALESEDKRLDRKQLDAGVRAILADPKRGRYFLASKDDRVIGQLAITYEWSDWRNGWFWWFQSVYVVPEARRDGIFSSLYEHVLNQARGQSDVCGLRLYVEDNNSGAQAVYAARGMHRAGYQVMELDFRNKGKVKQNDSNR